MKPPPPDNPTAPSARLPPQGVKPGYRLTDQQHLREHYGEHGSARQCAEVLGRSPEAVRMYVSRHPELRRAKG